MAPAPHRIYSQELSAAFRRGHAIAHPQPVEYQLANSNDAYGIQRPVEIGDVGYIQPEHGYFIRLFNVHLEPGVDGQPMRDRLPDDFEVLPKDEITKVTDSTPIFLSRTVTTKNLHATASGPFFGGSVVFSATSKRGAILATPDPIECFNACSIPSYMNYAKSHIQSWYSFFSQRHMIELENLILVTGVDRTTSWATAVVADTQLEAGFGLQVQFADTGTGLQLACQYSWQSTFGALVNSGPPAQSSAPHPGSHPSGSTDTTPTGSSSASGGPHTHQQPINTINNQSIFVRHIRAKRRSRWLGMKLKAAGEEDSSDDESDSGDSENQMHASGPVTEDIILSNSPKHEQYIDCLEPVLDYILEHSRSDIAIAHDDDLILLPPTNTDLEPTIDFDSHGIFSSLQPSSHHESPVGSEGPTAPRNSAEATVADSGKHAKEPKNGKKRKSGVGIFKGPTPYPLASSRSHQHMGSGKNRLTGLHNRSMSPAALDGPEVIKPDFGNRSWTGQKRRNNDLHPTSNIDIM